MKKMFKILVIDDAFFMRILLKKTLAQKPNSDFEFEVIAEASNGKEGLDLYKICNADIVTVDINMPQLNGLEFLKKVRLINPNVKAIIISTTMNGSVKKELENKNTRYLPKSFQPEYLYKILDELAVSSLSKDNEKPKAKEVPVSNKQIENKSKENNIKENNPKEINPKEKVKTKKSLDDDFLLDKLESIPISNMISNDNKPKETKPKNKLSNNSNENSKKIETTEMTIPLDFSSNLNNKDKSENKNKNKNKVKEKDKSKNNTDTIIFTDENIKLPKVEPSKAGNIKNIKENPKTTPLEKDKEDSSIYNHKNKSNEVITDKVIVDEVINTIPLEIKENESSEVIKEDIIEDNIDKIIKEDVFTNVIKEDNSIDELEKELNKISLTIDLNEKDTEELTLENDIVLDDIEEDILIVEDTELEELIIVSTDEELVLEDSNEELLIVEDVEEELVLEDTEDLILEDVEEDILIIEDTDTEEILILDEIEGEIYEDINLEDNIEEEELLIIYDSETEDNSIKNLNEAMFLNLSKKDIVIEKKLSKEDELILSSKYSYEMEIVNKVKDLEDNKEEIAVFKEVESKSKTLEIETPVNKAKDLSALDIALKKLENFDLDNKDGEIIFDLGNEEEGNNSSSMDLELALKNLGDNIPEITIEDTDNLKDSANNLELNNRVKDYNPNINNKKSNIAPPRNKELLDMYSPKLEKMYNLKVEKEVVTEPEKPVKARGFFSRLFNFKKKK